jgi:TonB family protein
VLLVAAIGVAVLVFLRTRPAPDLAPPPIVDFTPPPPQPSEAPPAPVVGTVVVETQPAGASISVNGEAKGKSPLELGLPVGNYEIRADLRGYQASKTMATVTADDQRVEVRLDLARAAPASGTAAVVSNPVGAQVLVDGSPAGQTPVSDLKLPSGTHEIEVSKEGFETWRGNVAIRSGKATRVEAVLKAVAPSPSAPSPTIAAVDPSHVYANTAAEVDVLARKKSGLSAAYPRDAPRLKTGQSISVSVSFVVTEAGDVEDVKVLESGGRIIDEAVVEAIRRWKYDPAQKQGQAVKVRVAFKQTFLAG